MPLSVAKQILDMREEIENNNQHAGQKLEVVYQAYCEIQKAHGHHPAKLNPSCSGCTMEMNKMLKNWFRLYDKGSIVAKASTGAIKSKPLVPVKDKKPVKVANDLSNKGADPKKSASKPQAVNHSDMSYGELLKEFEKTASKTDQKKINNGNKPKKAQLIEYFNAK